MRPALVIASCPCCGLKLQADPRHAALCPHCGQTIPRGRLVSPYPSPANVPGQHAGSRPLPPLARPVLPQSRPSLFARLWGAQSLGGRLALGGTALVLAYLLLGGLAGLPGALSWRGEVTATPAAGTARPALTRRPTATRAPTPAPTRDLSGCEPGASFVADVTIPDGSVLAPGATFSKTWRLRNSGTCAWGAPLVVRHVGGDALSNQTQVVAPEAAPGEEAEVTVPMLAPAREGAYQSEWQLCVEGGACYGTVFYARIVVGAPTPEPTSATFGQWFAAGDAALSVTAIERHTQIERQQPAPGHELVSVSVTYAHHGAEGTVHCNPSYLALMSEQVIYPAEALGLEPRLRVVNLAPGGEISGWVTFEIPTGSEALTLVWRPGLMAAPVQVPLHE